MRRRQGVQALWALLLTAGCSSKNGFGPGAAYDTGGVDSADAGADTGAGPDDSVVPAYWRLGASFDVQDGSPQSDGSQLLLEVLAEDEASICADSMVITAIQAHVEPPDPMVYTWWRISHDPPEAACDILDDPVPDGILIGIGEMHPEILAGLDLMGLSAEADSLNAAYASLDGGDTVYVFGVAGTLSAYDGDASPATDATLADGEWQIQALYAFSY